MVGVGLSHNIVTSKRGISYPMNINWVQIITSPSPTLHVFWGRGYNSLIKLELDIELPEVTREKMSMNSGQAKAAIPGLMGSQPILSEVLQTGLCCVSPARKLPVGQSVSCPATTRIARAQSSVPLIL